MENAFDEALGRLVHREVMAAQKARDDERAANVVAMLAAELGMAIAIVGQGDPGAINALMIGAEQVVAEVATEKGALVAEVRAMSRRARQGGAA